MADGSARGLLADASALGRELREPLAAVAAPIEARTRATTRPTGSGGPARRRAVRSLGSVPAGCAPRYRQITPLQLRSRHRQSGAFVFRLDRRLSHIGPLQTGQAGRSSAMAGFGRSASWLSVACDTLTSGLVSGALERYTLGRPSGGVVLKPVRDSWQGIGPASYRGETYPKGYVLSSKVLPKCGGRCIIACAFLSSVIRLRVRELREARGWTQDELAKRSRVARITIARIEAQRTNGIDFAVWERLASTFAVHPVQLVDFRPGEPQAPVLRKTGRPPSKGRAARKAGSSRPRRRRPGAS